jgi:hypothetical protein
MFKKMLFVFLLAVAVLAFSGYAVPTASACSTLIAGDCNPMFGPSFDAVQEVLPPVGPPPGTINKFESDIEITPNVPELPAPASTQTTDVTTDICEWEN